MSQEVPDRAVNHPAHYEHPSGVECIDVAEHHGFNLGNVLKYVWRAGRKDAVIQDLEKARWYLDREIARLRAQATGGPGAASAGRGTPPG